MSATQYIGRTYDIMAYQGVLPIGVARLTAGIATPESPGGMICTGIQKLLQRFLMLLTLKKGTKPYDLEAGTTFFTELQQGLLRTELDVVTAFSLAVGDISSQLVAMETTDTPDDERFSDASLLNLRIDIGVVMLQISVSSLAGAERVAILPLSIAV